MIIVVDVVVRIIIIYKICDGADDKYNASIWFWQTRRKWVTNSSDKGNHSIRKSFS